MIGPADAERRVDALLATAEIHHTDFAGGKLAWQRWSAPGAAPPLVLLHGGFGSWNHWFANIDALRAERELWSVDLPGLGSSGDVPRDAATADFVKILHAGLREAVGNRDYELAGFSFGAMLGAHLAGDDRCRRFTAIGAAGWGNLHVQVDLQPPPPPDTDWQQAESVHRSNLQALMFSPGAAIDELAVYLHAANLARHRFNSRALSRTHDFVEALPAVSGHLVAAWGSEDATAGGAESIAARRELLTSVRPSAGFEVFEGIGHWSMYEAPDLINALLLS